VALLGGSFPPPAQIALLGYVLNFITRTMRGALIDGAVLRKKAPFSALHGFAPFGIGGHEKYRVLFL
jgi:hypothetical protein